MLVTAKNNYEAYGPVQRIFKDRLYIVYAIDDTPDSKELFVLPAGKVVAAGDEVDPLFFPADWFDVIADKTSSTWATKDVELARGTTPYSSFPEWFENEFYIRAHDWDLEGNDYDVIRKYKKQYEELYREYIPRDRSIQ